MSTDVNIEITNIQKVSKRAFKFDTTVNGIIVIRGLTYIKAKNWSGVEEELTFPTAGHQFVTVNEELAEMIKGLASEELSNR